MDHPLRIAVIWHMHQPYYKDLITGEFLLPWVRLHATKDYYDMAAILDRFPGIRQTFNVVPSLLSQIQDYAKGEGSDKFLDLSHKPANDLSDYEKHFILSNFFLANVEKKIKPYPRYWEILHKRGLHCSPDEIWERAVNFSVEELRDLQLLFNLCWFDPMFFEEDDFLSGLVKKGRDFSEEEKIKLLEKQKEITKSVIPNYKRLMEEGRIELTTTPFYHPILPLLCDSKIASKAMPDVKLPLHFKHPEDARIQISRGIEFHKETFGRSPRGMWPSEGSVSEEALGIIADAGIKWVATDEEILEASTDTRVRRGGSGIVENPEFLYKPYLYKAGGKDISIVFRDHQLSDLIGFVYSSWEAKSAADDFVAKFHDIRRSLGSKNSKGDHLVSIILDGENCWEHYENDGWDFLTALYAMVESDPLIEMVTVSEHLEAHPPKARLKNVFPGSWINHNFKIWIGHEEDNLAWDYLKATRDDLVRAEKKGKISEDNIKKAWEHIYIAEGSDWCWWYGDEHSTDNDADFDRLFRKNLINVYALIDKKAPEGIFRPIISGTKHLTPSIESQAFISPTIDGEISSYFEWLGAAHIELEKTGGTMHKSSFILSHFYYGFNELRDLFMRLDIGSDVECDEIQDIEISIIMRTPEEIEIKSQTLSGCNEAIIMPANKKVKACFKDILEIEIPRKLYGAEEESEIEFYISVMRDEGEIERWPSIGFLTMKIPGKEFESKTWNAYA